MRFKSQRTEKEPFKSSPCPLNFGRVTWLKKRKIPPQHIVIQLFERSIQFHPKTHYQSYRNFYQCITPNFTVCNIKKPPGFLRKFSPCGKHLIAFSADQTCVEIYDYKGAVAANELLANCPIPVADTVLHSDVPLVAHVLNTIFDRFFHLRASVHVASGQEQLNRECSVFSNDCKLMIVGCSSSRDAAAPNRLSDSYRYNESLTPNPRAPLDDFTICVINLELGIVTDTLLFKNDKLFLSHNQCLSLYNNTLVILSTQHQMLHRYHLNSEGKLTFLQSIGRTCYADDDVLLDSCIAHNCAHLTERAVQSTSGVGHDSMFEDYVLHLSRASDVNAPGISGGLPFPTAMSSTQAPDSMRSTTATSNSLISSSSGVRLSCSSAITSSSAVLLSSSSTLPPSSNTLNLSSAEIALAPTPSDSAAMPLNLTLTPSSSAEIPSGSAATPSGSAATPSGLAATPSGLAATPSGSVTTSSISAATPSGSVTTPSGSVTTSSSSAAASSGSSAIYEDLSSGSQSSIYSSSGTSSLFSAPPWPGATSLFPLHTAQRPAGGEPVFRGAQPPPSSGGARQAASHDHREGPYIIYSLKHRLLTLLHKVAEVQCQKHASKQPMRLFCTSFDNFLNLRIVKMQLLDDCHVFIKYGSEDLATQRTSEPGVKPFYFALYNMDTTEMVGVYEGSSPEMMSIYERFTDFFRNARLPCELNSICSPANNIHARMTLERQKATWTSIRAGSSREAYKRILVQLPVPCQNYNSSPYLDLALFNYLDKCVSVIERPKATTDQPIRFYGRKSGLLKFTLDVGAQAGIGAHSSVPSRRLVAFYFHPSDPFAISVQKYHDDYVVNFHVRHHPT